MMAAALRRLRTLPTLQIRPTTQQMTRICLHRTWSGFS